MARTLGSKNLTPEERERRNIEKLKEREERRAKNKQIYDSQRVESIKKLTEVPDDIADYLSSIRDDYVSHNYGDNDEDVELLHERAHRYMDICDSCRYPIYPAGVAMSCGISEADLRDMSNRPMFKRVADGIFTRISAYAQRMLYVGQNAAGPIFALKNYGWKDTYVEQMTKPLDAKKEEELLNQFIDTMEKSGLGDFADKLRSMYATPRTVVGISTK